MDTNNFKRLERTKEIPTGLKRSVRHNVNRHVGLSRLVFKVFDLYVPKMIGLVTGTSLQHPKNNSLNRKGSVDGHSEFDPEQGTDD